MWDFEDEDIDRPWMGVIENGGGPVTIDGEDLYVMVQEYLHRPRDPEGEAMQGYDESYVIVKDDQDRYWRKQTYESSFRDEVLVHEWHDAARVYPTEKIVYEWSEL